MAASLFVKSPFSLAMVVSVSLSQVSFFMTALTRSMLSVPAAAQIQVPPHEKPWGPLQNAQSP